MSGPEIVCEAKRWLRYAAEDIDVAQSLLASNESAPRHICFLAQQAAEKALKAALVFEDVDFPFRHDLDALRNFLPDSWSVRREQSDLARIAARATLALKSGLWVLRVRLGMEYLQWVGWIGTRSQSHTLKAQNPVQTTRTTSPAPCAATPRKAFQAVFRPDS